MATLIHALEPIPNFDQKIFLAGPTPRGKNLHKSWRPSMVKLLEGVGFTGQILIPEPLDANWADNFDNQIEWEEEGLTKADVILFWIPRDLTGQTFGCNMEGLTTNIEFGMWMKSGKIVLGAPEWAGRMSYMIYYAKKLGIPFSRTMLGTAGYAKALLDIRITLEAG